MDFKNFQIKLGKKVQRLRESKSLSQEALAEKVDLSRTYIAYIESGTYTPSIKVLFDISKVLGIEIQELFTL